MAIFKNWLENKKQFERLFMYVCVTLPISIYQYFYIISPSSYLSCTIWGTKMSTLENHYIFTLKLFETMKLTFKNTNVLAKCSNILLAFSCSYLGDNKSAIFPSKCMRRPSSVHWYGALRMSLFIMWGISWTILVLGHSAPRQNTVIGPRWVS